MSDASTVDSAALVAGRLLDANGDPAANTPLAVYKVIDSDLGQNDGTTIPLLETDTAVATTMTDGAGFFSVPRDATQSPDATYEVTAEVGGTPVIYDFAPDREPFHAADDFSGSGPLGSTLVGNYPWTGLNASVNYWSRSGAPGAGAATVVPSVVSQHAMAVIDAHTSDVRLTEASRANADTYLVFRAVDGSNWLELGISPRFRNCGASIPVICAGLTLYQDVAGTITTLASWPVGSGTTQPAYYGVNVLGSTVTVLDGADSAASTVVGTLVLPDNGPNGTLVGVSAGTIYNLNTAPGAGSFAADQATSDGTAVDVSTVPTGLSAPTDLAVLQAGKGTLPDPVSYLSNLGSQLPTPLATEVSSANQGADSSDPAVAAQGTVAVDAASAGFTPEGGVDATSLSGSNVAPPTDATIASTQLGATVAPESSATANGCSWDWAPVWMATAAPQTVVYIPVHATETSYWSSQQYTWTTAKLTKLGIALTLNGNNVSGGLEYGKEATSGQLNSFSTGTRNNVSESDWIAFNYQQYREYCYNLGVLTQTNNYKREPVNAQGSSMPKTIVPGIGCKYTARIGSKTVLTTSVSLTWSGWFSVAGVRLDDQQTQSSQTSTTIVPRLNLGTPVYCMNNSSLMTSTLYGEKIE